MVWQGLRFSAPCNLCSFLSRYFLSKDLLHLSCVMVDVAIYQNDICQCKFKEFYVSVSHPSLSPLTPLSLSLFHIFPHYVGFDTTILAHNFFFTNLTFFTFSYFFIQWLRFKVTFCNFKSQPLTPITSGIITQVLHLISIHILVVS